MRRGGAFLILTLLSDGASAQQVASSTPQSPTDDEIVVTAEPGDQRRIDRRVYTVHDTAQTQTETAAEILRRVPAVTVSADGAVSLLGDSGVTIQIDGQPRVDAVNTLKTLQASQIARIEVITNPSAAFSAEGTAGIINIITRRTFVSGLSGSAVVGGDSFGGANMKLVPTITYGPWSVAFSLDLEHDLSHDNKRGSRDSADDALDYVQSGRELARGTYFDASARLSYKPSASRSYSLSIDHYDVYSVDRTRTQTLAGGGVFVPNSEQADEFYNSPNRTISFDYSWTGKRQGESLTMSASDNRNSYDLPNTIVDLYADGPLQSDVLYRSRNDIAELKLDYVHPLGRSDILSTGASILRQASARTEGLTSIGDAAILGADYLDIFSGHWTTAAVYATFQFPLAHWTLLPGIRTEDRSLDIPALGDFGHRNNLIWFPSFHATRSITKRLEFGISYSKRVSWPSFSDLNPAIHYFDHDTAYSGDPALKPELTDAFEASIDFAPGKQSLNLTLFDRQTCHVFSSTEQLTSNGVAISRQGNAGSASRIGGELSLRGPIWKGWRYSLSGDFADRRFDVLDGEMRSRAEEFSYSGNGQLEYRDGPDGRPGASDWEFDLNYGGPVRSLQSRTSSYVSGSFSWTHTLMPSLAAVLNIRNVFGSDGFTQRLIGDDFVQTTRRYGSGQQVKFSLTYRLGGKKK